MTKALIILIWLVPPVLICARLFIPTFRNNRMFSFPFVLLSIVILGVFSLLVMGRDVPNTLMEENYSVKLSQNDADVVRIGTDTANDIVLMNPYSESKHAEILFTKNGGKIASKIRNVGHKRKVLVDGTDINTKKLTVGDVITIGKTEFSYKGLQISTPDIDIVFENQGHLFSVTKGEKKLLKRMRWLGVYLASKIPFIKKITARVGEIESADGVAAVVYLKGANIYLGGKSREDMTSIYVHDSNDIATPLSDLSTDIVNGSTVTLGYTVYKFSNINAGGLGLKVVARPSSVFFDYSPSGLLFFGNSELSGSKNQMLPFTDRYDLRMVLAKDDGKLKLLSNVNSFSLNKEGQCITLTDKKMKSAGSVKPAIGDRVVLDFEAAKSSFVITSYFGDFLKNFAILASILLIIGYLWHWKKLLTEMSSNLYLCAVQLTIIGKLNLFIMAAYSDASRLKAIVLADTQYSMSFALAAIMCVVTLLGIINRGGLLRYSNFKLSIRWVKKIDAAVSRHAAVGRAFRGLLTHRWRVLIGLAAVVLVFFFSGSALGAVITALFMAMIAFRFLNEQRADLIMSIPIVLLLAQFPYGEIGSGLFQPIEITKTLMCIAFAYYAVGAQDFDAGQGNSWIRGNLVTRIFLGPFSASGYSVPLIIMMSCIYLLDDYSPVVIFGSFLLFQYFATRDRGEIFVVICVFAVIGWLWGEQVLGLLGLEKILARVEVWIMPWKHPDLGEQYINGLWNLKSGGFLGTEIAGGSNDFLIPEIHNDFILTFFVAKFGFVGFIVLAINYFLFFYAGFKLYFGLSAKQTDDEQRFAKFIVLFCLYFFAIQCILVLCSVLGILPVLGQPLPFLAAGNSHFILFCMSAVTLIVLKSREALR